MNTWDKWQGRRDLEDYIISAWSLDQPVLIRSIATLIPCIMTGDMLAVCQTRCRRCHGLGFQNTYRRHRKVLRLVLT